MRVLDGKVPYGILPGNHDMNGGYSPQLGAGATYYEQFFPASRYENYSYWGGSYDAESVISSSPNMNNYQLFSAGGMDFIALNVQYQATADVLSWAGSVLSEYPDRRAIISTHSYIYSDGTWAPGGADIWRNLVVPYKNVFLVLCGHEVPGEGKKIDNLDNGTRTVYQLLSDYQDLPSGGNGYLRIMKFVPSENMIYVSTYSPYLGSYMTENTSQFELYYPMNPTVATDGGISIWVYVGAVVVIVVIIAALLIFIKPF